MDVKDLMIGDWVQKRESDHFVNVQVSGISDNAVDYLYRSTRGTITVSGIEPIPLTPEILEKNGFEQMPGTKFFPSPRHVWINKERVDTIMIQVSIYEKPVNGVKVLTKINTPCLNNGGVNGIHNCDINYVHELQNAIRLCGIEKEIIL